MGSTSKPKPIKATPEEQALQRAQLVSLAKADEEINQRKNRIIKGQYGGFSSLLKSGGSRGRSTGGGASLDTGSRNRKTIPSTPPRRLAV